MHNLPMTILKNLQKKYQSHIISVKDTFGNLSWLRMSIIIILHVTKLRHDEKSHWGVDDEDGQHAVERREHPVEGDVDERVQSEAQEDLEGHLGAKVEQVQHLAPLPHGRAQPSAHVEQVEGEPRGQRAQQGHVQQEDWQQHQEPVPRDALLQTQNQRDQEPQQLQPREQGLEETCHFSAKIFLT